MQPCWQRQEAKVTGTSLSCSYQVNSTYSGMILHQKYSHNNLLSQGWIEVWKPENNQRLLSVLVRAAQQQWWFCGSEEGEEVPSYCSDCVAWEEVTGYWWSVQRARSVWQQLPPSATAPTPGAGVTDNSLLSSLEWPWWTGENCLKGFSPDSFTSVVSNCFNKYQRSK